MRADLLSSAAKVQPPGRPEIRLTYMVQGCFGTQIIRRIATTEEEFQHDLLSFGHATMMVKAAPHPTITKGRP